ncbi:MAG: Paraquat-inducible protein [Nevskia sp.]|nr:Paraquat-inducible protein [Nevskia sp.]
MTDAPTPPGSSQLPKPELHQRRRWGLPLIWLVPLVAALAAVVLVARTYLNSGPSISITFETAEGLEAGKTEVRYKDVVVGKVKQLLLSKDHKEVTVHVDLSNTASGVAVADTRFWVERPRVGIGGVSGISTLLSGAYIGVDIGASGEVQKAFKGLEKPPPVTHDQKGHRFVLHTTDAGSLAIGAPLYYRKMPVGSVVGSDLDPDGKGVTVQVFVSAPNDRFVTDNSRFWNASGVDIALGASGFKLDAQSLATVVAGGIAFASIDDNPDAAPAKENAEFQLYSDRTSALAPPDGPAFKVRMRFRQSTRGLSLGAPVDFQGITLGAVKSILLDFDKEHKDFYTDVVAELFPQRLGPAYNTLKHAGSSKELGVADMFKDMIDDGLRAQLRSGNVLTGQLYVGLDFLKPIKPFKPDAYSAELQIPTAPGSLQELQTQLQNIARKLDAVPFDEIGLNLRDTLKSANSLLKQMDKELMPEAKQTLSDARHSIESLNDSMLAPNAPLQLDARKTLEQLNRAAVSFRTLSDYLEQHPESLIRGKVPDPEPADSAGQK